MYANPSHIRNKRINLSVNEAEFRAAEAVAQLNGTQPAVFIRELFLEFLASRVHGANSGGHPDEMRATH